ncbi:MAG TPA: hypothetical protein VFD86_02870 [Nitrospira sp.]|nr:hypothetical protein [Nitrospira sp.]
MDQRAHDVEEDLKNILHTRMVLADKIQLLEQRVADIVHGTKAAALGALDLAKSKAVDFIESASHNLNPSLQAGRRPWIMVGSAVAVGFLAGLLEQRRRTSGVYPYYPPEAAGAPVMPSSERGQAEIPSGVYPFYSAQEGQPSRRRSVRFERPRTDVWSPLFALWGELADELTQERTRLQRAVLHAGRSFIHDVACIAGQSLLDQLDPSRTRSKREWQPRHEK